MTPIILASLLLFACAQSDEDGSPPDTSLKAAIEGSAEYAALCRTCPYSICAHVYETEGSHNLTCWTQGDVVGDTDLWLKTPDGCYLSEYDLIEYEGDFSAELEYCGHIPLDVTQERATVRYLSECIWGYETGDEGIAYYGRDVDITVTCWAKGTEVMGDPYWYKTLDYCWVSGSGLWEKPDRDNLEWCGPPISQRQNLTVEPLHTDGAKPTPLPPDEDEDEYEDQDEDDSGDGEGDRGLFRRWLSPGQISEESVVCRTCVPRYGNETCDIVTTYELNQTVVIQCASTWDAITIWTYTTDWCWMNGTKFWTEPWHHTNFPPCRMFDIAMSDVERE